MTEQLTTRIYDKAQDKLPITERTYSKHEKGLTLKEEEIASAYIRKRDFDEDTYIDKKLEDLHHRIIHELAKRPATNIDHISATVYNIGDAAEISIMVVEKIDENQSGDQQ